MRKAGAVMVASPVVLWMTSLSPVLGSTKMHHNRAQKQQTHQ